MKNGRFQAKDIDDAFFLRCVDWCSMCPEPPTPWGGNEKPDYYPLDRFPHWVFTWNLECLMPLFPGEVILEKARALIRRGLLEGCDCGCRGDFELTADGVRLLLDAGHQLHQSGWTIETTVLVSEDPKLPRLNSMGGEA